MGPRVFRGLAVLTRRELFLWNCFGLIVAAVAVAAYLAGAAYGAIVEGLPEFWRDILRPSFEREAHPFGLSTFVLMSLAAAVLAVGWLAVAISLTGTHPAISDAMNYTAAGAVFWIFRNDGPGRRPPAPPPLAIKHRLRLYLGRCGPACRRRFVRTEPWRGK